MIIIASVSLEVDLGSEATYKVRTEEKSMKATINPQSRTRQVGNAQALYFIRISKERSFAFAAVRMEPLQLLSFRKDSWNGSASFGSAVIGTGRRAERYNLSTLLCCLSAAPRGEDRGSDGALGGPEPLLDVEYRYRSCVTPVASVATAMRRASRGNRLRARSCVSSKS